MKAKATRKQGALSAADGAPKLYATIRGSVKALAALAESEAADSNGEAAKLLASIIPMVGENVSSILASAPASEPCPLSQALSEALTTANLHLHYAAARHPRQFAHARRKWTWPSLRYGLAVRKGCDEYAMLAETIGLGADLADEWGIKSKGPIGLGSVAVDETLMRVMTVSARRQEPQPSFMGFQLPQLGPEEGWPEANLPPLSRNPDTLRRWWEVIQRLLEDDRDYLLRGPLRAERDRQRKRRKTDAATWSYFVKACFDALKALASSTGKTTKSP